MKIIYRVLKNMRSSTKKYLDNVNEIIERYQSQGYRLTLRQLYYQLVVQNVIPNRTNEYKKLSVILREGRMAGITDWDAIEDRLRYPSRPSFWSNAYGAMNAVIQQFRKDRQRNQPTYIEVWVEKDALSGVLKRVTEPYGVPIVVNRGYSSATAMHDAYLRFRNAQDNGQNTVVLYLGDFDPSGLDMVRDIKKRIEEFIDGGDGLSAEMDFEIKPIALTEAQIKKYNPPKNPAKLTDSRAPEYIAKYGMNSWEVDALPPEVLHKLLEDNITKLMDMDAYNDVLSDEQDNIEDLERIQGLL